MRARGARTNPPNRFERLRYVPEPTGPGGSGCAREGVRWEAEPEPDPRTELLRDPSRSIVATNRSPDVGFDASVNPYRGCSHGCAYCYARPGHEYLGMSAGLDFETRILVKTEAPALLRRALASRAWRPQVVALSGVTDCYQPAERRLGITRGCLEVLAAFRNPVAVVTKSWLVTRDADLLADLAAHGAASVVVSVTTLDAELARRMEPGASPPSRRLAAIEGLAAAGVPVGVLVAPLIPGLTDHEMPRILEAAARAGAGFAGRVVLRLPHGVKEIFDDWLARELPERRGRVLARIREVRGGALSDPRFHSRQRGEGLYARQLERWFDLARRRAGLAERGPTLSTAAFDRHGGMRAVDPQLGLFDASRAS
ncbi:MAG: PA0069 family radical SAM protein [Myxococcota bacterium]|nr:PA0069 family radical SAM protein [Myxococcota bacterium]